MSDDKRAVTAWQTATEQAEEIAALRAEVRRLRRDALGLAKNMLLCGAATKCSECSERAQKLVANLSRRPPSKSAKTRRNA